VLMVNRSWKRPWGSGGIDSLRFNRRKKSEFLRAGGLTKVTKTLGGKLALKQRIHIPGGGKAPTEGLQKKLGGGGGRHRLKKKMKNGKILLSSAGKNLVCTWEKPFEGKLRGTQER